jgi:hypothetical protein
MLVRDVRRGSRKALVLGSPRMPNAKGNHLLLKQGLEITPTGLAPPRRECAGWVRAPQILRPHYASTLSSSYGTSSHGVDYGAVSEAARLEPWRSVTHPLIGHRRGAPAFAGGEILLCRSPFSKSRLSLFTFPISDSLIGRREQASFDRVFVSYDCGKKPWNSRL